MKFLTNLGLLSVVVALAVAGSGCKKNPKNVTPIPRGGSSAPVAAVEPSGPIRTSPAVPTNPPQRSGTLPSDPNAGSQDLTPKPLDPNSTGTPLPDNLRYGRLEDRAMFAADTVYFEFDRSNVRSSETDKVKRVAEFLKGNPLHDLAVEGHCDERGTEEYNRALGERRALSVRESLVSLGISASRITTTSFGEDQPADPGHDDQAWTKNRRAEFIILLPKTQ